MSLLVVVIGQDFVAYGNSFAFRNRGSWDLLRALFAQGEKQSYGEEEGARMAETVFKLILVFFLSAGIMEMVWLVRHREQVKKFVEQNGLSPRPAARNNVLIEMIVIGITLFMLVFFLLICS